MVLHGIALHLMILHSLACHCIVSYGVAGYCIVGFGARAVSRKTPTYFIIIGDQQQMINLTQFEATIWAKQNTQWQWSKMLKIMTFV